MRAAVDDELTAELGMLIADAIGARTAIVQRAAERQRAHQATAADLAAGFRAASEVLTFLDDFQSAWQEAVREITCLTPSELGRLYRECLMRFWQPSPEFLRAR